MPPGRSQNKRPSGNTRQPDYLQVFSSSPGVYLTSLETARTRLNHADSWGAIIMPLNIIEPDKTALLARFPRDFIDDLPIDRAARIAASLGLKLSEVIDYFEKEDAL